MRVLKQGLVGQDKRISMLTCTRAWGAWFQLVLKLDPLLLGRIVQFKQLIQDNGLIRLKNSIYDWSWKHNVLIKRRETSFETKLLKGSTCQDQNCFTLVYQSLFQNWHFRTCVASTWGKSTCRWVQAMAASSFKAMNRGEPTASYRRTKLSLRNNQLKFKTSGKLPIILEESMKYISHEKENPEDRNI